MTCWWRTARRRKAIATMATAGCSRMPTRAGASRRKPPCAPVLTGGPVVDAAWRRLLDRCGPRVPVPLTDEPDLHLVVDGQRLDATSHDGGRYVFRLAEQPGSVRIRSRSVVPQELGLARDSRSLGVALRHIAVRQGTHKGTRQGTLLCHAVKADDVRLRRASTCSRKMKTSSGRMAMPCCRWTCWPDLPRRWRSF